jgi:ABC-type multidrug transport system fused ATPase/permease subunit
VDIKKAVQVIGRLIVCALGALMLSAIQLLPFIELAQLSDRVVRNVYSLVTFRSFPPRELINFIFPFFFGNPAQFGGFTDVLIGQDFQDWLISPYVGIIPLILIIFAFGRKKKQTMFFLGTAIIGLLLAFGHYTPFYRLVFLIPGVSLIRYPVKYLFLVTFSLAVLAAFGFDHLYQAEREWLKKQVRIIWFVAGGLAIAFGLAFLLRQQIFSWLAGHYSARMPNYFFELLADMIGFNLLSFFFVVVYIAGLAVILMMYSRQLIRPVFFVFLLISLIAADLLANGANIAVPVSAWVMNKIPTNYQLLQKEQKMGRLFYTPELERENRLILGKNYDDALFEAKDNLTANWGIPAQIYDFYGYESVLPYKMYNFYRQNFKTIQLEKLSRYNVSFIAAERPIKLPGLRLLRHKKKYQLNVYLYENQKVRERAYLLLPGECTIKSYRPGNIIVQTATKQLNRLFLAESYYPGWRVYIDGREGKLRSAEELFCGVDLPAGEHLVSFTYQPLSFYLGTWLSGLTIVLMVAGGLFYFKKNR